MSSKDSDRKRSEKLRRDGEQLARRDREQRKREAWLRERGQRRDKKK